MIKNKQQLGKFWTRNADKRCNRWQPPPAGARPESNGCWRKKPCNTDHSSQWSNGGPNKSIPTGYKLTKRGLRKISERERLAKLRREESAAANAWKYDANTNPGSDYGWIRGYSYQRKLRSGNIIIVNVRGHWRKKRSNALSKNYQPAEPIITLELNTIFNECCLSTMQRIPSGLVDLAVTSPPYNMNLRVQNGKYVKRLNDHSTTKYSGFSDDVPVEQFYEFHSKVLGELLRVSQIVFYNVGIVTGSKNAFFRIFGKYYDRLKDVIVWDKTTAQPAIHEGLLNRQTELIFVFQQPDRAMKRTFEKRNFDRGTLSDLWQIPRQRSVTPTHKAVFPEALVEKIITNFSDPGDLIYDPFMGTGTTAKVALDHKRNFIGSEISLEYCEIARARIFNGHSGRSAP